MKSQHNTQVFVTLSRDELMNIFIIFFKHH